MLISNQNSFDTRAHLVVMKGGHPDAGLPVKSGLVAGTMVETDAGWRKVEDLQVGQSVGTYDGGMAPLRRLVRAVIRPRTLGQPSDGMLLVPGGALGNCEPIHLLDEQQVLIESAEADRLLGEPSVLVPAAALEGYRGITRVWPDAVQEVISLGFDDEEIVYANTGVLMHCPAQDSDAAPFFTQLDKGRARALIGLIEGDPEPFAGALTPRTRPARSLRVA